MKSNVKGGMLMLMLIIVVAFSGSVFAQNIQDTVLLDVWDETNHSLRMNTSAGGAVTEETTLTNTVNDTLSLTHTTTGTPANGIGEGIKYIQEVTSGNEIGMWLNTVVEDVTAASEDFGFVVMLMKAGAAATEAFRVTSTGVVTLVNDETIDNTVDGTITYTATTHALAGDVSVSGFFDSPYQLIDATSYTLSAASKANMYVANYTDTGVVGITLATAAAVDGRTITIKDGELNANTNNITIGTEGAETIDESATYVMDANGESVTLLSDGTNWFVIGAYLE